MGIKLIKSRQTDSHLELIQEIILLGKEHIEIAKKSRFYKDLRVNGQVANIIRACHTMMGVSGNFKNGCLYREKGLQELWKKGNGESVVCDHAIPIAILVRMHIANEEKFPIENLIFAPVVRLTKATDSKLTENGLAKKGDERGFPLSRYSKISGIALVAHDGREVDPNSWTNEDHWNLVRSTQELRPLLEGLGVSNLVF